MNYLGIDELAEGQKYSEPVIIDGDILLVPAGIPIRKKDIDFLKSLDIAQVMTEGTLLIGELVSKDEFTFKTSETASVKTPAPAVSTAPPPKSAPLSAPPIKSAPSPVPPPAGEEKSAEEIHRKLSACIRQLNIIFNEITRQKPDVGHAKNSVPLRQLWAITATLLQLVKEHRTSCLNFILGNSVKEPELAKSSINTAILSILMARELKFDLQRIPEVAAGALLHDIGMLRLPPEILNKKDKLSLEDAQIIKSHTSHSYQIITKELAYSSAVAAIALQHHERWDGTGYPQRLVGNAINPGARVVCVADAFEAMVSAKPYRNPMTGYLAIKTMVSENAAHFAPNMLKTFIKIMGMYPIGSGIALNDKRIARIINVNPEVPLRPTVQVVAGADMRRIENGEILDLMSNKNVFITQAVDLSQLS